MTTKRKPSARVKAIFDRCVDYCSEDEGMIGFDGLDEAIIGIGKQHGSSYCLVYSAKAIIRELMKQGMSDEGAQEWYGHNIECLYAGRTTPIILDDF